MALTAARESRGAEGGGGGVELSRGGNGGNGEERIKREHMFDKVVTPSDVGKLNRLVVPKQFAERHILPRLLGGAAKAACSGAVLRGAKNGLVHHNDAGMGFKGISNAYPPNARKSCGPRCPDA
ncbi:hypothetical protein TRIUR3_33140 [Triticum urartu]|uniref:Uncharacterized protein n=1 Tax=Triticum urartu TaxID=4572 RepID=M7ZQV2_TRIUA|nr:hypothetical protein TRIUR3_33140 [Triticum urartu]